MTFNVRFAKLVCGLTLRNLLAIPFGLLTAFKLAHILEASLRTDFRALQTGSLELLTIVIVYYTIDYFFYLLLQLTVERKKNQLKMSMIHRFLSLDMLQIERMGEGKMIEHLSNDLNELADYKTTVLPGLISASVTAVIYSGYFLSVNPLFALILAFISILHVIPPIVIRKYMYTQYMDTRDIEAELTNHLISGFKAFRILQIYSGHHWFMQQLKKIHNEYNGVGSKAEKTLASEEVLTKGVEHAVKFGTYGIVGYLIWIDVITLTNGLALLMLSPGFYSAVSTLCSHFSQKAVYTAANERLSLFHKINGTESSNSLRIAAKRESSPPLLLEVMKAKAEIDSAVANQSWHFQLMEHDHLLIQGKNGSGKSTLLRLLTRHVPLAEGQIYFRGTELASIPEDELFLELSLLPQADLKLSITPMQLFSLLYSAHPDILQRTLQLCSTLNLNDDRLSKHTISELSGGERKKVYLAAALMKPSASLLLLDEPDNSLDHNSKAALMKCLQDDKRALIIVSHDDLFQASSNLAIQLNREPTEGQERDRTYV
ncbi:ATP-binding cassette domain-containing protein [Paenibacillus piscarius]|uniref:ATP-binding cassette domain-containing protein n=1 Tax=Paenibacillus piscarius TaxID=1089681 RepID=UPI001EE846CD|nr:ABC transporter ATP-binding protein [Paenibacillus piscarius]